jgi:Protein of unknown function (DUF938)
MRLEDLDASGDGRLTSPSAARNKEPIAAVLSQVLPRSGLVLEVGSGTGEHAVHFARVMPHLAWQPTEQDEECLRSICAWAAVETHANVRQPLYLDVIDAQWPIEAADAIICINMIHIAPWAATQGLLRGSSRILPPAGLLIPRGRQALVCKQQSIRRSIASDQRRVGRPRPRCCVKRGASVQH